MKAKQLIDKIKGSKQYLLSKEFLTLGGNSKFAPSSLTFFVMISLVPVISLIVYILSLFGFSKTDLLSYLEENFSLHEQSMSMLEAYFSNVPNVNKIFFGITILVLIYISSKGMTFFMFAYAKINQCEHKYQGFFKQRFWGVVLSFISELFISFLILFFGFFDNLSIIKSSGFKTGIFSFSTFVLIFLFLVFLYSISSPQKVDFKDIYLGALFASLSITIGISLYIAYIDHHSNVINYYGSLTNFILLLLIIYYSSYISLLGIQLNKMKKNPHNGDSLNKL